jgi:hypothetical protein
MPNASLRRPLDRIEARALELWRERELTFPPFARRMHPDAIDYATGAWAVLLDQAGKESTIGPRMATDRPPAAV